jgi:hypothetical protein
MTDEERRAAELLLNQLRCAGYTIVADVDDAVHVTQLHRPDVMRPLERYWADLTDRAEGHDRSGRPVLSYSEFELWVRSILDDEALRAKDVRLAETSLPGSGPASTVVSASYRISCEFGQVVVSRDRDEAARFFIGEVLTEKDCWREALALVSRLEGL